MARLKWPGRPQRLGLERVGSHRLRLQWEGWPGCLLSRVAHGQRAGMNQRQKYRIRATASLHDRNPMETARYRISSSPSPVPTPELLHSFARSRSYPHTIHLRTPFPTAEAMVPTPVREALTMASVFWSASPATSAVVMTDPTAPTTPLCPCTQRGCHWSFLRDQDLAWK